jgi:UPF0716 protein FxsA
MSQGEMPIDALFDAACLALAGGLLLLPGFVTDLLALPLLLPAVRQRLRRWLGARLESGAGRNGATTTKVIEGEWIVVEEDKTDDRVPPRKLR